MKFPELPVVGGGYQVGSGDSEVELGFQVAPLVLTDGADLTVDQFLTGLIIIDHANAKNIKLPSAVDLDAALPNARVGSFVDVIVASLGAGTATVTTNTGWTLVGDMAVTMIAKRFRARKTGAGTWTLYQIA